MSGPGFIAYPSRGALVRALSDAVAQQLGAALAQDGAASLAVPGGTTPGPLFETLRGAELDWGAVSVVLTDERFVPESSARSNTALLRGTLLQDRAAAARLVPLYHAAERPEDVLGALTRGVSRILPLTVCVLGMGTDMHTASLFPGADNLAAALAEDAPAVLAMRAAGAPEPRLTLSLRVLRGAGAVHVMLTGQDKRAAYERARDGGLPLSASPISGLLDIATVHWAE